MTTITERLLLDTDVLIDYLRNRPEAVSYMSSLTATRLVSVITVAELYAGVREGTERTELDMFTSRVRILPVNLEIAIKGGLYRL